MERCTGQQSFLWKCSNTFFQQSGDLITELYSYLYKHLFQWVRNQLLHYVQCREEKPKQKHKSSSLKVWLLLKNTLYCWVCGLPLSSVVKLIVVTLALGGLCRDAGGLLTDGQSLRHREQACLSWGVRNLTAPCMWHGPLLEECSPKAQRQSCWLLLCALQCWQLWLTRAKKPLGDAEFLNQTLILS